MKEKRTPPIVLASASPRRRELMAAMGLRFTVVVSHADESLAEGTHPREGVAAVARRKAEAVAATLPEDTLVVAADTTVERDGTSLGKPKDESEATEMLLSLGGRVHAVHTGVTVMYRGRTLTATETTEVVFRPLTREEVLSYVATGEPMDKAGAYGIQGGGGAFVERFLGEYDNVVGLPCRLLEKMIAEVTA
ncbi:MAG: septum formation protein Maf [Clostridia bacterium]|nr:septum formation protein Maf [Clostridia bacterium]